MRARRTTRTIGLVLALSLLAAACGDNGNGTDPDAPDDTTNGDATPSDDEDISIGFWHIQTDHTDLLDGQVARFEDDHPNVSVDVSAIENDTFKTQIRVALGAGEPPCVFVSWGGGGLKEMVDAGQVTDVTEWVEEDGYRDRFIEASWGNVTFDERVYGVPVENAAAAFVWYDRALFDELGLEEPATWDELLELADELEAEGISPFALANAAPWTGSMYFMYLVDRLGGPEVFEAAADRTGGSFEDPVFIEAGEMLQDLVQRDAFNPGFNGLDWGSGQSRALMYAGNAAMEVMGSWNLSIIQTENEAFAADRLGVMAFPAIEGGAGDPSSIVGTIGDNYYVIADACAYKEEAFRMIQYLIDDIAAVEREAIGRIPPLEGFETDDALLGEVFDLINDASSVQLWYDQYLPPELAEVHLETTQALYALTMTPQEAAERMEAAAVSYYDE